MIFLCHWIKGLYIIGFRANKLMAEADESIGNIQFRFPLSSNIWETKLARALYALAPILLKGIYDIALRTRVWREKYLIAKVA